MRLDHFIYIVRPFIPAPIRELNSRRNLAARRRHFGTFATAAVDETADAIARLSDAQCVDKAFLENEFIPSIGLNDEVLHEQPPEFSANYGKGLHIWQYPNQLAGYLAWLARNCSGITSFAEIGCRWGGMFILVSEWIRRNGADLRSVTAVDPITPTPFIEAYFKRLRATTNIQANYLREFSTSPLVKQEIDRLRPDFVFIDGDHTLRGALADHLLVRNHARIIAHHDIWSQACPDTTFLWQTLKALETGSFDFAEFVEQYPSVGGNFFGIGAMKRRA